MKLCNILEVSPNYLFETLFDEKKSTPLDNEILVQYLKLSDTNKKFIDSIITHIYNIERKK
ncbi:MAG TPA: hypothetical protein OIM61_04700 [Clostridiaceae bacterium]|nr:hypothetical protein [Clostridiaceae bacterium]